MNDIEINREQEAPLSAMADNETLALPKPWKDPSLFSENEVQASYISGSFIGIVLAGAAYPFCVSLITLVINLFLGGTVGVIEIVLTLPLVVLVGSTAGMLVSSISGLFSIPIVISINRSLGNPLDARSAAISAGSLAGYMPTAWILFMPGNGLAAGLLGPILAMLLGAYGAAWSSGKYGGFDFDVATKRSKHRLSILNMMMATAWIAITFAIANQFGGLGFAIAAAAWFVLQAILLGIIHYWRKLFGVRSQPDA